MQESSEMIKMGVKVPEWQLVNVLVEFYLDCFDTMEVFGIDDSEC